MKKEYHLAGLSCASCGGKIETAVNALDGVAAASVNMMKSTLTMELDGFSGDIDDAVKKIVRRYEPGIAVGEHGGEHMHSHGGKTEKAFDFMLLQIIAGAAVFAAGMTLPLGEGVKLTLFIFCYAVLGWRVLLEAALNIARGQVFDENFLMTAATVGAFAIGETPEAAGVMLFWQIGEYVQDMAVRRSKRSITELMDIRPDFANVEANGTITKADPETVKVGDMIVVLPGEKIPLDGVAESGESMLDTRALTGESVPRSVRAGDAVMSGCINQTGVIRIRVTKTFGESTVAKIIDLVENSASKKAPTENFITTFARYYTPVVVVVAALLAVVPPLLFGQPWPQWITRGLVFLVISCPCALVISIPLGFFGGIGGASKSGVLVKGGNYLEALGRLSVVVFDKTGTLTKGVFHVTHIAPADGFSDEVLLEMAAYAESFSNHPIAQSVQRAYGKAVDKAQIERHTEILGHGVSAVIGGRTVLAGSGKLMTDNNISYTASDKVGTKVYVATDGQFAGSITISDEVKEDAKAAIQGLTNIGVEKIVMLTGDNAQIADETAKTLGISEVYAQLLPADKVERLERLEQEKPKNTKLAFVGDGINDAPVLARADIGIAMGGIGSDAAIEAADIVLMTDEPSKLVDAVKIARFTKKIVWQNIIFALGVKGLFLTLGAFGMASLWEAVFADVGVALLAILNAMRVMRR